MLVWDALRQIEHPKYWAVIFRRQEKELEQLTEYAKTYYPSYGGNQTGGGKHWVFPQGARIDFESMEHESDWEKYHGNNYTYMGFDELVTFTEKQYTSLFTWNRAVDKGLRAYTRWTSNPWPAERGDGIGWIMERFGIPFQRKIPKPIHL